MSVALSGPGSTGCPSAGSGPETKYSALRELLHLDVGQVPLACTDGHIEAGIVQPVEHDAKRCADAVRGDDLRVGGANLRQLRADADIASVEPLFVDHHQIVVLRLGQLRKHRRLGGVAGGIVAVE